MGSEQGIRLLAGGLGFDLVLVGWAPGSYGVLIVSGGLEEVK